MGVIGFAFILYFGIIRNWMKSGKYHPLYFSMLFFAFFSIGSIYLPLFNSHIPFMDSQRAPSRFLALPLVFLIFLACIQFQYFLEEWEPKDWGHIPWYFDNLLVGKPGAKLTLKFKGTAVAVFGLMYNNGLKCEAVLDGKELSGPYLRHFIEFGKGLVLAHGLPNQEHVLQLTVAEPSKRHNKLDNPYTD